MGHHLSPGSSGRPLSALGIAVVAVSRRAREDVLPHFDISPEPFSTPSTTGSTSDEYRPGGGGRCARNGSEPTLRPLRRANHPSEGQLPILFFDAVPADDTAAAGRPRLEHRRYVRVPPPGAGRRGVRRGARPARGRLPGIQEMVPRGELIQLYSHVAVFRLPLGLTSPSGSSTSTPWPARPAVVASKARRHFPLSLMRDGTPG